MQTTHIVKGMPKDIKEKRILRIKEAMNFPLGSKLEPTHNVIDKINGIEIYFDKPGKEFFRNGENKNINDMTPGVGDYYPKYAFKDIWKDLLNISIQLPEDSYKKLYVIIYRLAYMLDCTVNEDKVRFNPSKEIKKEIDNIQNEIDKRKIDFKVLEFLYFLDLIGWNEDVKYQSSLNFENVKKGRINNILSMISVPLLFKKFIDDIINNKDNLENIDYTDLIDIAQAFSRTRGVSPISNKLLIKHLEPYLIA